MFEEVGLVDKVIWFSFFMPIVLTLGLVWFFIIYKKRKNEYLLSLKDEELKRQRLIIERQNALEIERRRIAGEMHDDLGGGLTLIKFLGQKVLSQSEDDNQKKQLHKILTHTQILVNNMSGIIWAMNSDNDTIQELISYVRRCSMEFLEELDINCDFKVENVEENIFISGEQRRNIFLIIKEALNNCAKHARAKNVKIEFIVRNDLEIMIEDDGIGIDFSNVTRGYGLKNIKNRIKLVGGTLNITNNKGTKLKINVPLN